jgi:hypothetical protein
MPGGLLSMKKIVLQNGFAFVYLNSSFYNKDCILSSIETYKEFFSAHFSQLGKYFIVKIENISDHETKTLAEEFSNYLLSQEYQLKTK